jgi:hypothetical protein
VKERKKGISFCDVILAPGCDAFSGCKEYENIEGALQEKKERKRLASVAC